MLNVIVFVFIVLFIVGGLILLFKFTGSGSKKAQTKTVFSVPKEIQQTLQKRVRFYQHLNEEHKTEFENRIRKFLKEKTISGVETELTNDDLILVAASAVIPMFAFPYYNYPGINEILLYPNSFDHAFQTDAEVGGRNILGMVGDGYMKGLVLLSKPDLEKAFDGQRHQSNVGIHEFIHLIDKADGQVDGIPEILFEHSFAFAWLREIKKEINRIVHGNSDINPYALTNNAEFLAVVGEYFFSNPKKMKNRHPELYNDLVKIFHQSPDKDE